MNDARTVALGLATVCASFLALALSGPGQEPKLRPALAERLHEYVQGRARTDGFSGAVLVAKDGRPILARGYGPANREYDIPNTPQTKFRIGSLTKPITAVAILTLVRQGKLRLDDPVRQYVPEVPDAWEKVTVHHLLSHTGGVPEHTGLPAYRDRKTLPITPREILGLVRDRPLDFPPGEKFKYSNTGYVLLGMIGEKASGRRYADLARRNVFGPAGMNDSGYDEPGLILKGRASGYADLGLGPVQAPFLHMSWPYAAGGVYSTVGDWLRLDEALYGEQLLAAELRRKMFTPVRNNYGYGWAIRKVADRAAAAHAGALPGFQCAVLRLPDDHLCVAVFSNLVGPVRPADMADQLAQMVLGEKQK